MRRLVLLSLVLLQIVCQALGKSKPEPSVSEPVTYSGICGASAGAAVDQEHFVVADDEANQLRIYRRDQGGPPLSVLDLAAQLELDARAPEVDIEGAARLGDRIYWISSHSRNNAGKEHPNRCRFFATNLRITNGVAQLSFVGRPYKRLLADLASASQLRSLRLGNAAGLAPKKAGALNIEGLCATPDGRLLIGFRNPIPGGRALLVPLENASEVIQGGKARFGDPILLDLNGLGIRDLSCHNGRYLIIAGSYDGVGKSKLFSWSGANAFPKHLKDVDLKGLNPEALIVYPDRGLAEVQLLSDDSNHDAVDKPCKDLPLSDRTFRSVWVRLDAKHRR